MLRKDIIEAIEEAGYEVPYLDHQYYYSESKQKRYKEAMND